MPQLMVMAAIVATLLFLPVGAVLALSFFAVLGVSFHGFVTFGGALNNFAGVLAWWTLAFLAALVYAALVPPMGKR